LEASAQNEKEALAMSFIENFGVKSDSSSGQISGIFQSNSKAFFPLPLRLP
jgi:hypothetical protein